jgi:hypothetical protein
MDTAGDQAPATSKHGRRPGEATLLLPRISLSGPSPDADHRVMLHLILRSRCTFSGGPRQRGAQVLAALRSRHRTRCSTAAGRSLPS